MSPLYAEVAAGIMALAAAAALPDFLLGRQTAAWKATS